MKPLNSTTTSDIFLAAIFNNHPKTKNQTEEHLATKWQRQ
jgi:hypothetical protein